MRSTTTIEGWIANELQVRDAQGHRVVDVSVPVTPRREKDGRWEDAGETVWYRASFWDDYADAVLDRVNKGSLVTITGTVKVEAWEANGKSGVNIRLTRPQLSEVASPRTANASPRSSIENHGTWAAQPPGVDTGESTPEGWPEGEVPF